MRVHPKDAGYCADICWNPSFFCGLPACQSSLRGDLPSTVRVGCADRQLMDTKCMTSSAHRHKLALQPSLMTMETYTSESRSWRVPIPFLDFLVDGESPIEDVLGKGSDRLPTRLQPEWEHFSLDEQIHRLLGLGAPEYEDGRAAMYICRCGDLDCFGIGARIKREAGTITWGDWAWKDGFKLTDPIEELGTYTFTLSEYEEVLAGAARMLSAVPSWEPPKQKLVWPWQWGWKLAKEDDPMDTRIPRIREAVRQVFLETDPAGLGFGGIWFPESEYDTEVDRAISWLIKGRSPEDTAARTVRILERDWGVQVQAGKQEQLAQGLGRINLSEFTTR